MEVEVKKMELPNRKSLKLERNILKFRKELGELQLAHKAASEDILALLKKLLESDGKPALETIKSLEDLNYEIDNDILLNIENTLETIDGFEIDIVKVDTYLQSLKEEQDIIQDLDLSAKNLIKTASTTDNSLKQQELENLKFLYESYTKTANNTQKKLNDISEKLQSQIQKVKKMEVV
jgi:hypothetical protein